MTAITELVLDQPAATLATLGLVRVVPVPAAICRNRYCRNGQVTLSTHELMPYKAPCAICAEWGGSGSVPPTVTGRIPITASDKEPDAIEPIGDQILLRTDDGFSLWDYINCAWTPLPLGRVVGSAAAVIIPIVEDIDATYEPVACIEVAPNRTALAYWPEGSAEPGEEVDLSDHLPFGDWTHPYAALLTDPKEIS